MCCSKAVDSVTDIGLTAPRAFIKDEKRVACLEPAIGARGTVGGINAFATPRRAKIMDACAMDSKVMQARRRREGQTDER
jgi:hypothetical protein